MQVVQLFYIEHQIGGCTGQFGGLKTYIPRLLKRGICPNYFCIFASKNHQTPLMIMILNHCRLYLKSLAKEPQHNYDM